MQINLLSIGSSFPNNIYDECIQDAQSVYQWFNKLQQWHKCKTQILIDKEIDKHKFFDFCKQIDKKVDINIVYISSCGFRKKYKNNTLIGLCLKDEIGEKEVIDLLDNISNKSKQLLVIFDTCFSGVRINAYDPLDNNQPGIASDKPYRIKSIDIERNCEEIVRSSQLFHFIKENSCIIFPCQIDKFAYGKFDYQFGEFRSFTTNNHSLFTYVFFSTLWSLSLKNICKVINETNWRLYNCIKSTLPYKNYEKSIISIPKIHVSIGRKFDTNILQV